MKTFMLFFTGLLVFAAAQPALADQRNDKPEASQTQSGKPGDAPPMSEIPTMKEQGKHMATMMEKLKDITDPAERKRILAEAMCPQ